MIMYVFDATKWVGVVVFVAEKNGGEGGKRRRNGGERERERRVPHQVIT